jgi:nucleotide-binding universal stress UspA family protein
VLVATDGTASSDGALRLASLLHGEGADVRALAVLPPLAPYAATFGESAVIMPVEPAAGARRDALEDEVLDQMTRVLGGWLPIDVRLDWPADGVTRQAEEWGADLILMGVGRHRPVDRLLGSETTNRVLRQTHVPVLAVPPDTALLPGVVVVGIDFSKSSANAVRSAVALAGDDAEVHLVHVGPVVVPLVHAESPSWMELYSTGVQQRLDELADELREEHASLDIRTERLAGGVAEQLLAYANRVNADLIVTGAQRHSTADRFFFGTVSAQLVRGTHCAVLVTPVLTEAVRPESAGATATQPEPARTIVAGETGGSRRTPAHR